MTSPLLHAEHIAIEDRLQPTSLTICAGQVVGLVGPNGGGKTSLLRALAGIERTSGTVVIAGEPLDGAPPMRRSKLLGFLPASRDLAWPIAARDVIALGAATPDPARIEDLVETLELDAFADRPVNALSTGERARVLLARALVSRPNLLLLDEPLSNLDPYWVLRILELLRQSVDNGDCAALVSVHDLAVAEQFDRLLLLSDGRLAADGPPSEILASRDLATAFRIDRIGREWRIRRREDPRSSP
jgi:iron complex transport system ATP-binding protein